MSATRKALGVTTVIIAAPLVFMGAMHLMAGHPAVTRPRVAPSPRPVPSQAPRTAGGVLGVYEPGALTSWRPVQQFAAATGTNPELLLAYTGVGRPFPAGLARTAWSHGTSLLIQINPGEIPLTDIAGGAYDSWLRGYARQVVRFGHPVVLGFGHEMNGHWYPWGYRNQPAAAFVAAWRHIVTVFRAEGARNVTWLWTISSSGRAPLRSYWPGPAYVTWVGLDGYYYLPQYKFGHVFGMAIRQVRRFTSAPILLSEAAVGQTAGQARMIPDLFAGIRRYHLLGLVWFDEDQHDGIHHQDWRLEGHPKALIAFHQAAARLGGEGARR